MRRKEVIYCSYCGEKNNINEIECKKCKKKIYDKDHLFKQFIKEHIKSDVEDNFFSLLTNFIKSHLYGTFVTLTLIFSVTSVINNVVYSSKNEIKEVKNIVNICSINVMEEVLACNDGYNLEDNICVKEEKVKAKYEKVCSNGYTLKNNQCISDEKFNGTYKDVCEIPKQQPNEWDYDNPYNPNASNLFTEVDRGKCYLMVVEMYNEDGEPGAGTAIELPFTKKLECPSGTENISGECRKTSPVLDKYSCSDGALVGNDCLIKKVENANKICPEGSTYNASCNRCLGD